MHKSYDAPQRLSKVSRNLKPHEAFVKLFLYIDAFKKRGVRLTKRWKEEGVVQMEGGYLNYLKPRKARRLTRCWTAE